MSEHLQRREFLRRAVLAGTTTLAAGTPLLRSLPALAAKGPNEKLNLACIGVANKGADNINNLTSENIVALCDIDSLHLGKMAERFPAGQDLCRLPQAARRGKEPRRASSSRRPTTRHAIPVMWRPAARAGRVLRKAAGPLGVRSAADARRWRPSKRPSRRWARRSTPATTIAAWSRSSRPGRSARSRAYTCGWAAAIRPGIRVKEGTPPSTVDYDLWIGPAPMRPFNASHFHFNWRYWWDFGGGTLADFGCHYMDLPFWALDLRYPTSIEAKGEKTSQGDNDVPDNMQVDYHFPARGDQPPVHLTWYHGAWRPEGAEDYGKTAAVLFEGRRQRPAAGRLRHAQAVHARRHRARSAAADDSQLDRPLGRMGRGLQDPRTHDLQLRLLRRAGRDGAAGQCLVPRRRPKTAVGRRSRCRPPTARMPTQFIKREYRAGWTL